MRSMANVVMFHWLVSADCFETLRIAEAAIAKCRLHRNPPTLNSGAGIRLYAVKRRLENGPIQRQLSTFYRSLQPCPRKVEPAASRGHERLRNFATPKLSKLYCGLVEMGI